jgi:hypothetical protein
VIGHGHAVIVRAVPLQATRSPTSRASHACTTSTAQPTSILPSRSNYRTLVCFGFVLHACKPAYPSTNTTSLLQAVLVVLPRQKAASPLSQHQYGQIVSPTSHLPPPPAFRLSAAWHGKRPRDARTSPLAETWIHEDRRHITWRTFTTALKELAVNKPWIPATQLAETP